MPWQSNLHQLLESFHHPAWGLAHALRVRALALTLARAEGWALEAEALLAAAYLHDLGALGSYRRPGMAHELRSIELLPELLGSTDFPAEKLPLVEAIVRWHTFDAPVAAVQTAPPEAICFHDADLLDFLGYIGVARMFAVAGQEAWVPDRRAALALLQRFAVQLPPLLVTVEAQRLGAVRLAELEAFLAGLSAETEEFVLL